MLRVLLIQKMLYDAEEWSDANSAEFNLSDVAISGIDATTRPDAVRFTIAFTSGAGQAHKPQRLILEIAKASVPDPRGACHEVRLAPDSAVPPDPYLLNVLFHEKPGCGFDHYVLLDADEQDVLHRDALGIAGQAKMLDRYGLRMISFSTQTITTTSFGDMVPLTRGTRLATAIEPIWGFFLLGLAFRASLGRRDQDGSAGQ